MSLQLEGGDELRGDELLVAVGRRPRTDRARPRDRRRRAAAATSRSTTGCGSAARDWLYAIGDVNGRALLTHMGKYQARICADVILGKDVGRDAPTRPARRGSCSPSPQLAAVGLTLEAAEKRGIKARAVDVATAANAGASFSAATPPGTSRIVVDEERERDRRRHASSAPRSPSRCTRRRSRSSPRSRSSGSAHAVPAFPTRNEIWLKLLEEYGL